MIVIFAGPTINEQQILDVVCRQGCLQRQSPPSQFGIIHGQLITGIPSLAVERRILLRVKQAHAEDITVAATLFCR